MIENPNFNDILLYTTAEGKVTIEVLFENETFWLSQKRIAELFGVEIPTINYHIKEIFKSGELVEDSVIRKFLTTAADGKKYQTQFYNLDVIIAVGYRVNSHRATQFMLLISDGDDWTKHTPEFEFPFIQRIYGFYKSENGVENAHFPTEKHDYNASKRQAAYPFLAKHLGLNLQAVLKDGKVDESINSVLPEKDLKVFNEAYPVPQAAIKGNNAILKVLAEQK